MFRKKKSEDTYDAMDHERDRHGRILATLEQLEPVVREQAFAEAVRWLEDKGRFDLANDMREHFEVGP